jgi:hypothetical protein
LDTLDLKFEFETYEDMSYAAAPGFQRLHTFEMEEFVAGFCFSDATEAFTVHGAIVAALPRSVDKITPAREASAKNSGFGARMKRLFGRSDGSSGKSKDKSDERRSAGSAKSRSSGAGSVASSALSDSKASAPVSDPADVVAAEWLSILQQAGIPKSQLRDPNVMSALAGVVNSSLGAGSEGRSRAGSDGKRVSTPCASSPTDDAAASTEPSPSLNKEPSKRLVKLPSRKSLRRLSLALEGTPASDDAPDNKVLKDVTRDIHPALAAKKHEIMRALASIGQQGGFGLKPVQVRHCPRLVACTRVLMESVAGSHNPGRRSHL